MSKPELTKGALEIIITGGSCEKPVIQVLGVKKIQSQTNGAPDRYRLLLSDGVHSVSSVMLATQLNGLVEKGSVDTNCVICMQRYICNTIQADKKVIVLLELEVMAAGTVVGGKIGDPQALKQPHSADSHASNQQQQQATTNNQQQPSRSSNNKPTQAVSSQKSSSTDESHMKIFPISSLTPYQGRWTIKARVTLKTKIRTWSNAKGEGQLFSFNLADASGEIRVTAFKNEVDRFYNLIELNKAFYIKNGQLKAANKQFSNLANDYEMTLSADSEVLPVMEEDQTELPTLTYNFVTIDKIQNVEPNTFIDVIGVVREAEDVRVVMQRSTSKELRKREVTLADQSNTCIRLTLWGDSADQFDASGHPVIALKGCKVSDWNGRSLGESTSTQLILNPPLPEANVLRGWFDRVGASETFTEYKRDGVSAAGGGTKWMRLDEVSAQDLEDRAEYFQCKATIVALKRDNCLYMACSQPDCNKKVVDLGNSMYRCEKCSQELPTFKWRLILQMNVCDSGGSVWQTCFQEAAEQVLQQSAQHVGELKMQEDSSEFDELFDKATFTSYIFKCRAKMEKYNDENRLKIVCLQVTPIDHVDFSERLLDEMTKLLGGA